MELQVRASTGTMNGQFEGTPPSCVVSEILFRPILTTRMINSKAVENEASRDIAPSTRIRVVKNDIEYA